MQSLIDKYRIHIGIVLVIVILVGLGFLLYLQPKVREARQSNQNLEIIQQQINDLQAQVGQIDNASAPAPAEVASSETGQVAGVSTTSETPQGKINLNSADVTVLDSLPGIGPVYAQRIIDYRQTNGPFKTIEDIQNVKGIGPKTFEKFKNLITVE